MAAYAAVASLKNTINRILHSSRISLVPPSPQIIQLAFNELDPLQEILKRLDSSSKTKSRKEVNALDEDIKEVVWKFEDSLESHLSDQILSQSDQSSGGERDVPLFSIYLECLRHDVVSFVQKVRDMEEQYIHVLGNLPEVEEEDEDGSIDFGGAKSKMVGLSDHFEKAKKFLLNKYQRHNASYSFVGTAGIGKTTIAREIFEDPMISSKFEGCAWVRIGRRSRFNEIARDILAQVDPNTDEIREGDDKNIGEYLKERLEGKRCLIVLDDVWDTEVFHHLMSALPPWKNGKLKVLLTARDRVVTSIVERHMLSSEVEVVRFLNEEESKDLLREKVFGEEAYPSQLEEAAEKIAKNCDGLPLLIVAVADHLSKAEKTPEYWSDVAEKRNSVFTDAYDAISKVLFPSYDYLPQYLKMFFLYMGVFSPNYNISPSKFINMLTAEEFLEKFETKTVEEFVQLCLNKLNFEKNMVIANISDVFGNIKTFHLHSSWHHLCKGEARKLKFFNVLNTSFDALEETIRGQRRLCLHNSILFGIKEFYDSVKCNCWFSAHSLLCLGPYHPYQVSLDADFKLLRVLDALKLRFYDFPLQILKLVHLQYLSLTYNGVIPSSISKLFYLQFLIIHPHTSIKSCGAPSILPIQIWDMQELVHIEILGSSLPNPNCADSLKKLSTLLGVSPNGLTREVLKKIPNIKKLGIQIELTPNDTRSNRSRVRCFDHISELQNLETLKCSITNLYGSVPPLARPSMFPPSLKKLHLSGLGYPWKYMKIIGSLPNLKVLKLRCYAFRGREWRAEMASFTRLQYLLIEDTDLVQWKPSLGSFRMLTNLTMRHCYKLEKLEWPSDADRGEIKLINCNPLAVTCAKQLRARGTYGRVYVSTSSLEDGYLSDDPRHKIELHLQPWPLPPLSASSPSWLCSSHRRCRKPANRRQSLSTISHSPTAPTTPRSRPPSTGSTNQRSSQTLRSPMRSPPRRLSPTARWRGR